MSDKSLVRLWLLGLRARGERVPLEGRELYIDEATVTTVGVRRIG